MNNLDRRKKIGDGIRHSKIKKDISIGVNTDKYFNDENKYVDISDQYKKDTPNNVFNKSNNLTINNYLGDSSYKKDSFFLFIKRNKVFLKSVIFILLYLYILFFIFNKLENTEIEITPKTEKISEIKKISSYLRPEYNQLGFSIMMLSDSRQESVISDEKVNTSDRASGEITIFNNYSTEPQRLSPNTRFESVSGKVFRTSDNWIEIPGKTTKGPGTTKVIIYADEVGPEYNIDVTDFTIPGFKEAGLTAKYNDIYALSLKSFSGGFNGDRLKLSDNKRESTIHDLESELKENLINRLAIEKTNRAILVDNSIQIVFDVPVLEEDIKKGETRIIQKANIFAVIIDKKNLEDFLRKRYLHNVDKDDVYLLDSGNFKFVYGGGNIDFKELKNIDIDANIDAIFEWRLDINLIKESLRGLNKRDILDILKEFDEIDSAVIKIRPFWRKFISNDLNRIKIKNLGNI